METNIVPIRASVPERSRDYSPVQMNLIRRTVAADCNTDEFDLFVEVCRRVGLDAFRRQIYAIVYSKDKPDKRKMSIITGIDGFRAIAARCGDYRPDSDEAMIILDPELKNPATNPHGIERAVYTAYKRDVSGEWFPVKASAYWDEFAPITDEWAENDHGKWRPTGKQSIAATSNWRKMGRVMIVKCAEAQALRKGWPEDLSGIYTDDEMERTSITATATEITEEYEEEERLKRVGGKGALPFVWGERGLEMVPAGMVADRVIGHVKALETSEEVNDFMNANRAGLQQYWAVNPSEALEVKQEIEGHAEALESPKVEDGDS